MRGDTFGHDRLRKLKLCNSGRCSSHCDDFYQGGHNEYFKYMYDLLKEKGAPQIKIFGGGGETILPSEIKELQDYGIERIYHP